MKTDPRTFALREALQRITDDYVRNAGAARQPSLIEDLKSDHPHKITLVALAVPGKPETFRFTCYEYALDIVKDAQIATIARQHPQRRPFPGNQFVTWLAREKLSERREGEVRDGDLVLYFAGREARHAGLWSSGVVRSKWGDCHTWQHALSEVPTSFGDEVRVFVRPHREETIRWFREFVRSLESQL